jgi:hypothetical protein
MNRRSFLRNTAVSGTAVPAFIRRLFAAPPNGVLRLASFGGGGLAWATLDGIATHPGVQLACVAEVDSARLNQVKRR